MASGIVVQLAAHGNEIDNVPVMVEILDQSLQAQWQAWLRAQEARTFELRPGVFGVRASLASGVVFEKSVEVRRGQMTDCRLPLHDASPHESNEWAYFTQPIDAVGGQKFTEHRYLGLWIRLWERLPPQGEWRVVPFPVVEHPDHRGEVPIEARWAADGVNYSFRTHPAFFRWSREGEAIHDEQQYAVQVGGPMVPWKCVAVPTGCRVEILVRPTAAPLGRTHPLDVIVSTSNVKAAALLGFVQRGDMALAQSWTQAWAESSGAPELTAERLLAKKVWDPPAAAVGGYYLLRARAFERLHDWANNLANWFPWMADGAIIRAWQMIADLRRWRGRRGRKPSFEPVCLRLLEAVDRGVPLYSEGLRLLREGLLLCRSTGVNKSAVESALKIVSTYVEASDPTAAATTFTGSTPDRPSSRPKKGPVDIAEGPFAYVHDVPLAAAMERGLLKPGDILTAPGRKARIESDGTLTSDRRQYATLAHMAAALHDDSLGSDWAWKVKHKNEALGSVVQPLRELPR